MSAYSLPKYAEFIRSIREAPDDDLPRMVCSDWLEEQGEAERAEFIRCQVEKSRLERESGGKLPVRFGSASEFLSPIGNYDTIAPDKYPIGSVIQVGTTCPRDVEIFGPVRAVRNAPSCPLRDRWRELAKLEGELWEGNPELVLFECMGGTTIPIRMWGCCGAQSSGPTGAGFSRRIEWRFSRGFCESIRIRGADWITHADEIVKRNPVRKVVIVGNWPIADFASPWTQERYKRELKHKDYPGIEFTFEREEYSYSVAREERFFTAADG